MAKPFRPETREFLKITAAGAAALAAAPALLLPGCGEGGSTGGAGSSGLVKLVPKGREGEWMVARGEDYEKVQKEYRFSGHHPVFHLHMRKERDSLDLYGSTPELLEGLIGEPPIALRIMDLYNDGNVDGVYLVQRQNLARYGIDSSSVESEAGVATGDRNFLLGSHSKLREIASRQLAKALERTKNVKTTEVLP